MQQQTLIQHIDEKEVEIFFPAMAQVPNFNDLFVNLMFRHSVDVLVPYEWLSFPYTKELI